MINVSLLMESLAVVSLVVACGGQAVVADSDGGVAGSAGGAVGGSGGAVGGSGGAVGGSGGAVGGSGGAVGGSGGAVGGSGGGTAGTSAAPSCTKDSDCKLVSDCCTCAAYGSQDPVPPSCPQECLVDTCTSLGLPHNHQPRCVAGACVVSFDCDQSHAMCDSIPPTCAPGKVLSVRGGCWGGCVDPKECAYVSSCDVCKGANNEFCVEDIGEGGSVNHCVFNKDACSIDCGCLGHQVCQGTFHQCEDGPSLKDNKLMCTCPEC